MLWDFQCSLNSLPVVASSGGNCHLSDNQLPAVRQLDRVERKRKKKQFARGTNETLEHHLNLVYTSIMYFSALDSTWNRLLYHIMELITTHLTKNTLTRGRGGGSEFMTPRWPLKHPVGSVAVDTTVCYIWGRVNNT
jgi:hypothetical protein